MGSAHEDREDTHRALYYASPLAMVVWDCERRVVDWNQQAERVFGWAREEVLGKDFFEFLLPDSALPALQQVVASLLQGQLLSRSINENLTKSGETILCEWNNSIQHDGQGRITGVISLALDITERTRVERELRLFLESVENSSDAVGMSTPEGKHYYQNKAFSDWFGDIGQNPPETLYVDRTVGHEVFRTIMGGGQWTGEVQMYTKDRRILMILLRAYASKDKSGRITALVGVHTDITAKKAAETVLQETRSRLQAIVDSTRDLVWSVDIERYGLVSWNRAVEDYFRRDRGMAIAVGMRPEELFPANSPLPQQWNGLYTRAVAEGPFVIEKELSAGTRILALSFNVMRRDDQPFGISVFGQDITERKRAEAALTESEERHRATLASMTDLVFVLDEEGRFLDAHVPQQQSRHALPADFRGKPFAEVLPAAAAEALARQLESARRGVNCRLDYALDLQGERSFWSANITARLDSKGRYRSVTMVSRDMTESRRLEERLRQREKMDAIGQLAGGIAHDFNNQLAGILGHADLLENKLADPVLRRYAESIRTAACRAADLTQQLLAFARKGKHLTVDVDLHEIVRETVAILERSIDKRIEIRLRLEASPSVVTGDPAQLQSVVLNLGLNARDAMPQGGELVFATAVENLAVASPTEDLAAGGYLVLSVTDSGVGMDADTRKRLFEPFFTTKEPGKGTGLGLASVYGAVKNHGGVIRVFSEPGRGSTFRIHLPLSAGRTSSESPSPSMPLLARGRGRILFVDDEVVPLDAGRELLSDLGYEVTACGDPIEALHLYERDWRRIDLVILDMVMPKMGAKDLYLAMRRINPHVRALLASGYAVSGEAQGILDAGVLAFLQKPFRQETLARVVAEAMGKVT